MSASLTIQREVGDATSLEILKTRLDGTLSDLVEDEPAPSRGVGLNDL